MTWHTWTWLLSYKQSWVYTVLDSAHISAAVENGSQHWNLPVQNRHSHGQMNMDANAVVRWGKKCSWISGSTVDGAAGSGRCGTKSGLNKFDQILKQVNNQERESKVVTFPQVSLSLSLSLFKNFSTFTQTHITSCSTYNPKLSSDWLPYCCQKIVKIPRPHPPYKLHEMAISDEKI
jgi:hypothetical protein